MVIFELYPVVKGIEYVCIDGKMLPLDEDGVNWRQSSLRGLLRFVG